MPAPSGQCSTQTNIPPSGETRAGTTERGRSCDHFSDLRYVGDAEALYDAASLGVHCTDGIEVPVTLKHDWNLRVSPLDTLAELWSSERKQLDWRISDETVALQERESVEGPQVLLCHDFANGYHSDAFVYGSPTMSYTFWQWHLIDTFCYFSHHLVTLPTVQWLNAAHKAGVRVIGTFITEWDDGRKVCNEILSSKRNIDRTSRCLAKLAKRYNFEGWLLNIENPLDASQIPAMISFVRTLQRDMREAIGKNSFVVWYDSVIITGELIWQNELNLNNGGFFDAADAIFLNYNWTAELLAASRAFAAERPFDVYVGVDVWGRGCPGGGEENTNVAMKMISEANLSSAIFAPGWTYECEKSVENLGSADSLTKEQLFWDLLKPFLPQRRYLLRDCVRITHCTGSVRAGEQLRCENLSAQSPVTYAGPRRSGEVTAGFCVLPSGVTALRFSGDCDAESSVLLYSIKSVLESDYQLTFFCSYVSDAPLFLSVNDHKYELVFQQISKTRMRSVISLQGGVCDIYLVLPSASFTLDIIQVEIFTGRRTLSTIDKTRMHSSCPYMDCPKLLLQGDSDVKLSVGKKSSQKPDLEYFLCRTRKS